MNAPLRTLMTVEQFHAWLDAREATLPYDEPKWELFEGVPEMQAQEQWLHGRLKYQIMRAIEAALLTSGSPYQAAIDSLGVVMGKSAYVPEVVVFPKDRIRDEDRAAPDPVLVVEVLSPSSRAKDLREKSVGYGRVPTIAHYLAVDPEGGWVHHFKRQGKVLSAGMMPLTEGEVRLDPPGITLWVAVLLPATRD
jgi:Uma2 family endonuclease